MSREMLIEFGKMNEQEMHRMVREVYPEGCIENAREKYLEREDLTRAIQEEEDYFVGFLKRFMENEKNRYYVLEDDGKWVSALRLTKLDGFYYLEALETAPEHRRNGYAEALINEVISLLKKRGQA
ncbi:MAG: GNAT family N-acetyltransferase, partial [Lachnospiraceae bacterium]|nr:GNAT family N-acetyltransferase [Lachnospiraceae bacterium]